MSQSDIAFLQTVALVAEGFLIAMYLMMCDVRNKIVSDLRAALDEDRRAAHSDARADMRSSRTL